MVLVDTSVWVDHRRAGDAALAAFWTRDERLSAIAAALGLAA